MKFNIVLYCVGVLLLASSCGTHKRTTHKTPPKKVVLKEETPKEVLVISEKDFFKKIENKQLNKSNLSYIKKYAAIAVREMNTNGIPASITLAQGILESGSGNGELASRSNNHFGIKCHSSWRGERVYHDDDKKGECFRKYKYVETSYKDHSEFLTKRSRYAFLFAYEVRDYKRWARGLKKAGYATDKRYPDKLIKIIETYQLYELDKMTNKDYKVKEVSQEKMPNSTTHLYYQVQKGDTLYAIAKKFNTTVESIKALNNLKDNAISIGQTLSIN